VNAKLSVINLCSQECEHGTHECVRHGIMDIQVRVYLRMPTACPVAGSTVTMVECNSPPVFALSNRIGMAVRISAARGSYPSRLWNRTARSSRRRSDRLCRPRESVHRRWGCEYACPAPPRRVRSSANPWPFSRWSTPHENPPAGPSHWDRAIR